MENKRNKSCAKNYKNLEEDISKLFQKQLYIPEYKINSLLEKYGGNSLAFIEVLKAFFKQLFSSQPCSAPSIIFRIFGILNKLSRKNSHNRSIISLEKKKVHKIEGKTLDAQQIEAVAACEDTNLVIAAAGSGKTLSLLAKLKYIVEELGIPSNQTLVISFTRNTTKDLKERIERLGLRSDNVKTFHALGNSILRTTSRKRKKLIQDRAKVIKEIIDKLRKNNETFTKSYNDYILNYHSTPFDVTNMKDASDLINFNKSFLRESLKKVSLNKNKTAKKHSAASEKYIRSKEKQIIADFLYINQIPYAYKKPHPHVEIKYKPDFTIDEFNEPIYLEHFNVNRETQKHPSTGEKAHLTEEKWKRKVNRDHNTTLIESYSYMQKEGTLLEHIESELKRAGKDPCRMNEKKISKLIEDYYQEDLESFWKLCVTFLNLFKNSRYSMNELEEEINSIGVGNEYQRIRSSKFLEVFKPIYERYEEFLESKNLQDFADMIKLATQRVKELSTGTFNFKYILVDEAQDLSYGKFALLKALLDKCPGSRLFAVGDDWQSIYRFTGSDLTLINDFEDYFEKTTYRSLIETTHRFGEPAVTKSTNFIQGNSDQISKNVIPTPDLATSLNIHLDNNPNSDAEVLDRILNDLVEKHSFNGLKQKEIHILSRYNRDLDRLRGHSHFKITDSNTNKMVKIKWTKNKSDTEIEMEFSSMHKAKGLTKDIIIIINCNEGFMGIPATQEDDPILEILLSHPGNFPFAEERRLFYVALTRAKEETHIIATRDNPSRFLFEIDEDLTTEEEICPICKTGELVVRKSKYGSFRGCKNFVYGCDHTENLLEYEEEKGRKKALDIS